MACPTCQVDVMPGLGPFCFLNCHCACHTVGIAESLNEIDRILAEEESK